MTRACFRKPECGGRGTALGMESRQLETPQSQHRRQLRGAGLKGRLGMPHGETVVAQKEYKRLTMFSGTSLVAQWLRLCISNAGGMGSIPGRGTKIPYTLCHSQKKKQRDYDLLLVSRPRLSWAERGMLLDQSQSPVLPLSPHPQPPVIPTITLLHCSESATSPSPEHLPAAPPPAQLPEGPGH